MEHLGFEKKPKREVGPPLLEGFVELLPEELQRHILTFLPQKEVGQWQTLDQASRALIESFLTVALPNLIARDENLFLGICEWAIKDITAFRGWFEKYIAQRVPGGDHLNCLLILYLQ